MIFIPNRYTRIYYSVIERAQSRILPKDSYREKHHVIPRCMDGSMEPEELGQWVRYGDLAKFAELIVRECAEYAEHNLDMAGYKKKFMLKHFGVEE